MLIVSFTVLLKTSDCFIMRMTFFCVDGLHDTAWTKETHCAVTDDAAAVECAVRQFFYLLKSQGKGAVVIWAPYTLLFVH